MGALLRAVLTRKSFPRGGISRGHGAQHRRVDRNIRQAPLPTLRRISLSRFSFLLSLPSDVNFDMKSIDLFQGVVDEFAGVRHPDPEAWPLKD
jgi:hypothetical protein